MSDNDFDGDGRHVPLAAYSGTERVLISRSEGEPVAYRLGDGLAIAEDALVVEGGGGGGGGAAKTAVFTVPDQAGVEAEDGLLFTEYTVRDSSGTDITAEDETFALDSGSVILTEAGIYLITLRVYLSSNVSSGTTVGLGLGLDAPKVLVSSAPSGAVFHLADSTQFVKTNDDELALGPSIKRYNNGTWGTVSFDARYTVTKLG